LADLHLFELDSIQDPVHRLARDIYQRMRYSPQLLADRRQFIYAMRAETRDDINTDFARRRRLPYDRCVVIYIETVSIQI
jgi:hypothetical protein